MSGFVNDYADDLDAESLHLFFEPVYFTLTNLVCFNRQNDSIKLTGNRKTGRQMIGQRQIEYRKTEAAKIFSNDVG